MVVLFVHGMGRSPLSGWPMLHLLRRAGLKTRSFSYLVSIESFSTVHSRLEKIIAEIALHDEYVLVGHSLGGVLIRAALNTLPSDTQRPQHVFLLGSPIKPSRLAQRFSASPVFRLLTQDCGHLLSSEQRMADVGATTDVLTTSIVGSKGISWKHGPFNGEQNDGVVSLAEVSAAWLTDQITLPMVHSVLPSSPKVARIILRRLGVL